MGHMRSQPHYDKVRNVCGATGSPKTAWATCDLNHIMTRCEHFGKEPSNNDIAEMRSICAVVECGCRHDMVMMINSRTLIKYSNSRTFILIRVFKFKNIGDQYSYLSQMFIQ